MSTSEFIMVLAIILAPILAVQVQRSLDIVREKRKRKLNIFHTLMATRGSRISQAHVQALNMIDIEFYGKKIFGTRKQKKTEKVIVEAWKEYHDHLNTEYSENEFSNWVTKGEDLFVELLLALD